MECDLFQTIHSWSWCWPHVLSSSQNNSKSIPSRYYFVWSSPKIKNAHIILHSKNIHEGQPYRELKELTEGPGLICHENYWLKSDFTILEIVSILKSRGYKVKTWDQNVHYYPSIQQKRKACKLSCNSFVRESRRIFHILCNFSLS